MSKLIFAMVKINNRKGPSFYFKIVKILLQQNKYFIGDILLTQESFLKILYKFNKKHKMQDLINLIIDEDFGDNFLKVCDILL